MQRISQYIICCILNAVYKHLGIYLWLILFGLNLSLSAQNQFNFYALNSDNGLSQNSVWDIVKDEQGYLWLGTAEGLNRWDGYTVKCYYPGNNQGELKGNTNYRFFKDSDNNLWVSHNKGISLYNKVHDSFENILITDRAVCILGEYNKRLYVLTNTHNISVIDLKHKQIQSSESIAIQGIGFIPVSASTKALAMGNMALVTLNNKEVMLFNMQNKQVKLFKNHGFTAPIKLNDSTVIFTNFKNTIWFNLKHNSYYVKEENHANNKALNISAGIVWQNKLLLATPDGISAYSTNDLKYLHPFKLNEFSLTGNIIDQFYIDEYQNLYIGTNLSGLLIVSQARNKFKHLKTNDAKLNMLKAISVLPNGNIVTGQFGSHLVVYNSSGAYKEIKLNEFEPKAVLGIHQLNHNELLNVTQNHLIFYNHLKSKITRVIKFSEISVNQYPVFYQNNEHVQLNLNLEGHGGIYDLNTKTHELKSIYSIKNNAITAFYPCNKNAFLIGTEKGLFYLNNLNREPKMLIQSWIKSIRRRSNGDYLIATVNGLFVYSENIKLLKHYQVKNGLKVNFLYAAIEDKLGNVWMSSNKGIGKLETTGAIKWFTKEDGLQSNEFNTGAYTVDNRGTLYFGGVNGLNIIYPGYNVTQTVSSKTAINQLLVNDESFETDTQINLKQHLILDYKQNTLSFEFSCSDYSNQVKNKYNCRLAGFEPNDVDMQQKHFIRYANLPPGNYTFMVQSAGDHSDFGSVKQLAITINPPFWLTLWFKVLMLFFGVLVLTLVFYLIKSSFKRKAQRALETQKQLEKERLRIARDLHDHVGVQLSLVLSNIDFLPKQLKEEPLVQQRLQHIKEAGSAAIQMLRETIWAINVNEVNFESLVDRFKGYVLKVFAHLESIEIVFSEEIKNDAVLKPADALNLFRSCQEALQNIIKHSNCNKVIISFAAEVSNVSVSIYDNGIGFDLQNAINKGNYGIKNMQTRMSESNGNVLINSGNHGTTITFTIHL